VALIDIPSFESNSSQIFWNAGDLSSGMYIWQLMGQETIKLDAGKLILLK
jgi:hypothetical protein